MKYFLLKADRYLENSVKMKDFNDTQKLILLKKDQAKYKDGILFHVKGNKDSVFPDLFEAPVMMISERLYEIFTWYENTIIYKTAMLIDSKNDKRKNYRVCLLDSIEALSDKTTYLKNGWLDKMVLDSKKIEQYNIFYVKAGVNYYIVVSLDVVESMLRRGFFEGIKIEEIEVV